MKNKEIVSAAIGGVFFAVPYLVLAAPILPSIAIGAMAFGAGELLLGDSKPTLKETNRKLYNILETAKKQNKRVLTMIPQIEDEEIKKQLNEIHDSVSKIIETVEKKPKKVNQTNNFFDYYLPILIKIVKRYDEIEDNDLSSKEGKSFMLKADKMIGDTNNAFKTILSSLYQKDLIDIDADMKVYDLMLKADGIVDDNLIMKESVNDE